MRYRIAHAVVTAVLVALAWPLWAQTRSERLVAGEQKTLKPAYAVGDIAIGNPAVCDFRVISGRREVMLVAVQTGFTTLTIWDQRGTKRDEVAIEIVSREFARILVDMTELLRPYPDVVIKPLGDRAVLTGTVNTPDELQTVKTLANAAGNLICTVTLRRAVAPQVETPAPVPVPVPLSVPPPPAPTVTAPDPLFVPPPPPPTVTAPAPPPLPPPVPTVTYDPEPPAPVRRTPVATPPPVSLGVLVPPPALVPLGTAPPPPATTPQPVGATPPAALPVPVPAAATPPPPNIASAPPSIPSVAPVPPVQPTPAALPVPVPAAATPPPPNITSAQPSTPSVAPVPPVQPVPTPAPASTPSRASEWNTPAGSSTIEYLIELYESPASAPPPEVAGPQGKRLYTGRLRSDPGVEVRQLIRLGGGTSANSLRGLSIGLTPSIVDNAIHTAVVVDTNLPLGTSDQKNPVWTRCALAFTGRAGQTRFIPEAELARSAAPIAPPPAPGTSPGHAGRVAGQVIDTGAAVAGVSIPSFGGLLGSSQSPSQPKARRTTLLIVVTPSIPARWPRADDMTKLELSRHESTHGSWR